jgi:hypothetical protein
VRTMRIGTLGGEPMSVIGGLVHHFPKGSY